MTYAHPTTHLHNHTYPCWQDREGQSLWLGHLPGSGLRSEPKPEFKPCLVSTAATVTDTNKRGSRGQMGQKRDFGIPCRDLPTSAFQGLGLKASAHGFFLYPHLCPELYPLLLFPIPRSPNLPSYPYSSLHSPQLHLPLCLFRSTDPADSTGSTGQRLPGQLLHLRVPVHRRALSHGDQVGMRNGAQAGVYSPLRHPQGLTLWGPRPSC